MGFFSCDISEFIIDLIHGFSLSEMVYSPPVTRSGGVLEDVTDAYWSSFLSLETQKRGAV